MAENAQLETPTHSTMHPRYEMCRAITVARVEGPRGPSQLWTRDALRRRRAPIGAAHNASPDGAQNVQGTMRTARRAGVVVLQPVGGHARGAQQRRPDEARVNLATGFATGSAEMPLLVRATLSVVRYCELVHHNTGQSWATLDGRRATSYQGGGTGSNPVGAASKVRSAIVFC